MLTRKLLNTILILVLLLPDFSQAGKGNPKLREYNNFGFHAGMGTMLPKSHGTYGTISQKSSSTPQHFAITYNIRQRHGHGFVRAGLDFEVYEAQVSKSTSDFHQTLTTASIGYFTSSLIQKPHWNRSTIIPSVGFGLAFSGEIISVDTTNTTKVLIGAWSSFELEKQLSKKLSLGVYCKGMFYLIASEYSYGSGNCGGMIQYYVD